MLKHPHLALYLTTFFFGLFIGGTLAFLYAARVIADVHTMLTFIHTKLHRTESKVDAVVAATKAQL